MEKQQLGDILRYGMDTLGYFGHFQVKKNVPWWVSGL